MVIETEGLTKIYGKKTGCSNVSITVREGEVFGFLGPNGAGKSTFIKMMTGLLFSTSGKAFLLGKPVGDLETRKRTGYLPENFKYQDWMTGADLLSFHASLYKMDKQASKKRIVEVLELVNLKGHERYRIGTYSKGMQQRLGLASALLTDPEMLFLDEPTSALDPIGRKEVRDIIRSLRQRGKTVLLNSHLLSEVEMTCDSVAIINKGTIIARGRLNEILEGRFVLDIQLEGLSDEGFSKLRDIDPALESDGRIIKMTVEKLEDSHEVASIIIQNGGKLYELSPHKENLENRFISLVNSSNSAQV